VRVNRFAIHALFLLLLPVVVAVLGLGVPAAALLVLLTLAWRWALTLSTLAGPPRGPALRLETISASHFVEKVRWCLDRLGVPYVEDHNAGTLGIFFIGRSVPRLHVRTFGAGSVIGNSSDILRYLWGRYAAEHGARAAFLEPTAETLALERRFDAYGVDLQRWIYFHALPDRRFTLHAWGADDPTLPAWQRAAITLLYPLLRAMMTRAFRLGPETHRKAVADIERLLEEVNERLADGRKTLLGGPVTFADITFAALSGIWAYPPGYGRGKADAVAPAPEDMPPAMAAEMAAWRERYPRALELIERLYRDERSA
jgi:glutathione S-transferase